MLHTLALLGSTAFDVELQMGAEPIFIMEGGPAQPAEGFFPTGMEELMSLVDQLNQQPEKEIRRATNPCAQDQKETRCRDAACLKSNMKTLSPICATFLQKTQDFSRPSPSPQAVPAQSNAFYSVSFIDEDGEIHSESGQMNSAEGRKIEGEMESMLDLMIPAFGSLFEEVHAPHQVQAPPPTSSAPCATEVQVCVKELRGVTARSAIQQCLVSHYAALSSKCKCFLHQVMGDELEKVVPGAKAQTPEKPLVRSIAAGNARFVKAPEPPKKRSHQVACALFMSMFLVSVVLVLRRLCSYCCAPKVKHMAFVPPEQGVNVKMSVEPLVFSK